MAATSVPTLTPVQFAQRLASMFPRGWAGDDAKATGLLAGVLQSLASQMSVVLAEVQYVQAATLLGTATAPELDAASVDFFGTALPRPAGMNDAAFAAAIEAALLKSAATRPAVSAALTAMTGTAPRIIEPWNAADTGCWDSGQSYWNVDTPANPARLADVSQRFQAFIETVPLKAGGLNGNPLQTFDDGAFWNVAGYLFSDASYSNNASLFHLADTLRAAGVTFWMRLTTS